MNATGTAALFIGSETKLPHSLAVASSTIPPRENKFWKKLRSVDEANAATETFPPAEYKFRKEPRSVDETKDLDHESTRTRKKGLRGERTVVL